MKKRMVSILLTACLVLALLPVSALADGDFVEKDGVLVKYTGKGGDLVIPDGFTKIEMSAFKDCGGLTSVTIPGSVDLIGTFAFTGCGSLGSVIMRPGVRVISAYAFYGCDGLISVGIPSSVTRIGGGAFLGCHEITEVYYEGSEEQWRAIRISTENENLENATIHYNSTAPAPADAASPVGVTINGNTVQWPDAAPFIDAHNRTMVPLRPVADAMGLEVDWNANSREASFTDGSKTIFFYIGSSNAYTSEFHSIVMNTEAVIVDGRTYAPIRYLAEFFGYRVNWDGSTRTVIITSDSRPEASAPEAES